MRISSIYLQKDKQHNLPTSTGQQSTEDSEGNRQPAYDMSPAKFAQDPGCSTWSEKAVEQVQLQRNTTSPSGLESQTTVDDTIALPDNVRYVQTPIPKFFWDFTNEVNEEDDKD